MMTTTQSAIRETIKAARDAYPMDEAPACTEARLLMLIAIELMREAEAVMETAYPTKGGA